ncbi:MAG TPA: hypothetical protein VMF69_26095, partial [Gemmataceae bacterium]|nr:hypothetical protein [Gemmataceae bacterium]
AVVPGQGRAEGSSGSSVAHAWGESGWGDLRISPCYQVGFRAAAELHPSLLARLRGREKSVILSEVFQGKTASAGGLAE